MQSHLLPEIDTGFIDMNQGGDGCSLAPKFVNYFSRMVTVFKEFNAHSQAERLISSPSVPESNIVKSVDDIMVFPISYPSLCTLSSTLLPIHFMM